MPVCEPKPPVKVAIAIKLSGDSGGRCARSFQPCTSASCRHARFRRELHERSCKGGIKLAVLFPQLQFVMVIPLRSKSYAAPMYWTSVIGNYEEGLLTTYTAVAQETMRNLRTARYFLMLPRCYPSAIIRLTTSRFPSRISYFSSSVVGTQRSVAKTLF